MIDPKPCIQFTPPGHPSLPNAFPWTRTKRRARVPGRQTNGECPMICPPDFHPQARNTNEHPAAVRRSWLVPGDLHFAWPPTPCTTTGACGQSALVRTRAWYRVPQTCHSERVALVLGRVPRQDSVRLNGEQWTRNAERGTGYCAIRRSATSPVFSRVGVWGCCSAPTPPSQPASQRRAVDGSARVSSTHFVLTCAAPYSGPPGPRYHTPTPPPASLKPD